jgi:hypothetical protein
VAAAEAPEGLGGGRRIVCDWRQAQEHSGSRALARAIATMADPV